MKTFFNQKLLLFLPVWLTGIGFAAFAVYNNFSAIAQRLAYVHASFPTGSSGSAETLRQWLNGINLCGV